MRKFRMEKRDGKLYAVEIRAQGEPTPAPVLPPSTSVCVVPRSYGRDPRKSKG